MDSFENLSRDELLRIVRRMSEALIRDDLTGLFKGTRLDFILHEEIVRSRRYGYECALLFLDMDKFKILNDSHGHVIGSKLLAELGSLLKDQGRIMDWPFRYGGDEFAFLFAQISKPSACLVAQRLSRMIKTNRWLVDHSLNVEITTSIGLAAYPFDANDAQSMIAAADRAMYLAKKTGRGKVAAANLGILPDPDESTS